MSKLDIIKTGNVMSITCFISHSWANGGHEFALRLARELRLHGIKAWLDEEEIPGGVRVKDELVNALQECDFFLFIVSPTSIVSSWCCLELDEALKYRTRNGLQIIPIFFQDCTIPHKLTELLYLDFRQRRLFKRAFNRLVQSIDQLYPVRSSVQQLIGGDNHGRFIAAQKIYVLKNQYTVPILIGQIAVEPDPTVRHWIYLALKNIGGKEAQHALEEARRLESDPFAKEALVDEMHSPQKSRPHKIKSPHPIRLKRRAK
jgi:hypothetical protein